MKLKSVKCLLFAIILFCSVSAWGEETASRIYKLPGHGSVQLQVPVSWRDELRQPPNGMPPTILFSPGSGDSFKILFTPIFAAKPGMTLPSASDLEDKVKQTADIARMQSVETSIPVQELRGSSVAGYYFSSTDRSPKPGEYKYLTQGMFRVGELSATFTVLTNDDAGKIATEAIAMMQNAAHLSN